MPELILRRGSPGEKISAEKASYLLGLQPHEYFRTLGAMLKWGSSAAAAIILIRDDDVQGLCQAGYYLLRRTRAIHGKGAP